MKSTGLLIGLVVTVLAALPSYGGDPTVLPQDVLSVVTADWNDDGRFDRAVLVASNDPDHDTELFIFLSGSSTDAMTQAVHKVGVAWSGTAWGTQPGLELTEHGSLLIRSEDAAIGRNRWQQILTVAYRNDVFVVAGYTYSDRDTLEPESTTTCDVNLLTGSGTLNGRPYSSPVSAKPLVDWSDEDAMALCK